MKHAIILVRFTALLLIWGGLIVLIRNLLLSFDAFNPSYLFHYFQQELLTPCLLLGAGLLLRVRAKKIAQKLVQGSPEDD